MVIGLEGHIIGEIQCLPSTSDASCSNNVSI
ncbi:uncharacterized protein METZ01_LOCUS159623 [marine metagenome]|uniref:Uncharacterized protein n=1 Tax=marine metagenome TaxID=408172 RepID=A0A382AZ74_9ZZZZ